MTSFVRTRLVARAVSKSRFRQTQKKHRQFWRSYAISYQYRKGKQGNFAFRIFFTLPLTSKLDALCGENVNPTRAHTRCHYIKMTSFVRTRLVARAVSKSRFRQTKKTPPILAVCVWWNRRELNPCPKTS